MRQTDTVEMIKDKTLYTAGRNGNWYNHYRKKYSDPQKN